MMKSGFQLLTSVATAASPGVLAPKSPITAKRSVPGSTAFASMGVGRLETGSSAWLQEAIARRTNALRSTRRKSPLLGGVGEQIAESAELGSLGHARAVLVVGGLLGVLFKGSERHLCFAAAGIDLDDLGFEPRPRGEMLAKIGAALGSGVA